MKHFVKHHLVDVTSITNVDLELVQKGYINESHEEFFSRGLRKIKNKSVNVRLIRFQHPINLNDISKTLYIYLHSLAIHMQDN